MAGQQAGEGSGSGKTAAEQSVRRPLLCAGPLLCSAAVVVCRAVRAAHPQPGVSPVKPPDQANRLLAEAVDPLALPRSVVSTWLMMPLTCDCRALPAEVPPDC